MPGSAKNTAIAEKRDENPEILTNLMRKRLKENGQPKHNMRTSQVAKLEDKLSLRDWVLTGEEESSLKAVKGAKIRGLQMGGWIRHGWIWFFGAPRFRVQRSPNTYLKGFGTSGRQIWRPKNAKSNHDGSNPPFVRPSDKRWDAALLLTVGRFLLTVELHCLQWCLGACLLKSERPIMEKIKP